MRRLSRNLVLGTVFSGLVLGAVTGWAKDGHRMHGDPAQMVARMADKLDLSDDQQTGIEAILSETREQSATDHARLRELRQQLRAQRGAFDADEAKRQADEIGQITSRMVYQAASTQAQIYQLLDDGQRAELDRFMEDHEPRRHRWQKRAGMEAK
jgi:Spy/CpxP family protein refolding chaperone